ncbi:isochorismatase family protein [Aliiglaciecola lipolytica]|uniref:nicotinamidase n=1 Tax=Aliiglaciecola lipolytica E3 TaxID=1127673 RepID=K6WX83_9ALTE|nr:isochorismatase family protein [Aliiglaciecola lipolytica]GAC13064.1 nicotinamidase/pyrazinamidase [Aliiglaciecola lipolytica E3]
MKSKVASINVDPQKGFTPICPDELPVVEGDQIVPELLAQNALADLIIGSSDAHCEQALFVVDDADEQFKPLDYPNTDCTFKIHCRPGTKGFELLDGLPAATEYDFFVWKGVAPDLHPYGACYHDLAEKLSTGLIEYLVFHQVDKIIVGGLATDFCVATTAKQLQKSKRFDVAINLAACRGISPEGVAEQLDLMQEMGITVLENSQAVKVWISGQGIS